MEDIHFVGRDDVLFFHDEEMKYSGTTGWIRDNFELDACIESPKHTFDGNYLLDLYGMAAKYISAFAIRHPFSDGNKRIGAVSAVVFLEANGIDFRESYEGELADKIYQYLRNEIDEKAIEEYLRMNSNV